MPYHGTLPVRRTYYVRGILNALRLVFEKVTIIALSALYFYTFHFSLAHKKNNAGNLALTTLRRALAAQVKKFCNIYGVCSVSWALRFTLIAYLKYD